MFDKHKRESLLLRDLLKKLIIIVIGSIVAAYGITLALYAGFGGATLAVLWQGIAETFHLSIGMASFVVAVGMILFALIYDKSPYWDGAISNCIQHLCGCICHLPCLQYISMVQLLYHVAGCYFVCCRDRTICVCLTWSWLL
mgnify:CR=1 FL=1